MEKKRFGSAERELIGIDIESEPVPFENQRNCVDVANAKLWVANKFGFPNDLTTEIVMFELGKNGIATAK